MTASLLHGDILIPLEASGLGWSRIILGHVLHGHILIVEGKRKGGELDLQLRL